MSELSPLGAAGTADAQLPARVSVEVVDQFADKFWRLTNLYYIIDDSSKEIPFRPNEMQLIFLREMWYLNDILKGRQHGFTTLIDIWALDECVFYPNVTAGIIAQTLDDVKKIFRRKVKHPYDKLPDQVKASNPPINDTTNELIFKNKSELSVDTSMRSGTMNILHVSEFGWISAQYPDKAKEIKTGSWNTVHPGNYIFVESTGHGKGGEFHALTKAARDLAVSGRPLSQLDFKYHFYPWWMNPKYTLPPEDTRHVVFTRQDQEYFTKLEKKIAALIAKSRGELQPWLRYWRDEMGSKLTLDQKAWYLKKRQWNGSEMFREFPSHDDEPFEAIVVGSIFGEDFAKVRAEGRVTRVRHEASLAVNTWWDIGHRDKTAIWFYQQAGNELRFIWYHQESFKGLPYFVSLLNALRTEHKWSYGRHLGPHDMAVTEWGSQKTRWEMARDLGYTFDVASQFGQADQINAGRALLGLCLFDEENCAEGIACLENARREWNDHLQAFANEMRHDEFSHGASSWMNGAMNLNRLAGGGRPRALPVEAGPRSSG